MKNLIEKIIKIIPQESCIVLSTKEIFFIRYIKGDIELYKNNKLVNDINQKKEMLNRIIDDNNKRIIPISKIKEKKEIKKANQINELLNIVKEFYKENNLSFVSQQFGFEKMFYTFLVKENYEFNFIKEIILFAKEHNFYKKFLGNPVSFKKNFNTIAIEYNSQKKRKNKNNIVYRLY